MNCSQRFDLLLGYTSGDLSGQEKAELETHLAACPECAERLAGLMDAESCIKAGLREPIAAPDLADAIMAGLRATPVSPLKRLSWAWAGALAAAAGVAFAGWLWWHTGSPLISVAKHDIVRQVRRAPVDHGVTNPPKPKTMPPGSPRPRPIRRPIFVRLPEPGRVNTRRTAEDRRPHVETASTDFDSSAPALSVPATDGDVHVVERPVPVNKHESWRPPLEPEVEGGHTPVIVDDAGRGG